MNLKISLCQMDIQLGAPEENLHRVERWVASAARGGSGILLLPELWSTGYDLANASTLADPLGSGIFSEISRLARTHGICIGGSTLEKSEGRVFNTFTIYGPDGSLQGCYRKVHLFRLMAEDTWLQPGDQLTIAETASTKAGMSICYDLRFPEIFRFYAANGAQVFLIPAEWPAPRIEHWRVLLRARAIENQVFVAAVNRVGKTNSNMFAGCSAVISPWGEVIVEGGSDESLLTAEIDLDEITRARQKINIQGDRRPDVYRRYS